MNKFLNEFIDRGFFYQCTNKEELSNIKDSFCYLFVGHWLQGSLGQDRKDIGMMIKTYCEAFKREAIMDARTHRNWRLHS